MQTFVAKVTSAKTLKTLAVEVSFTQTHPKYKKVISRKTKLLVHNELEGIKEGDSVKIGKSRPYSKTKHFKVIEKVS